MGASDQHCIFYSFFFLFSSFSLSFLFFSFTTSDQCVKINTNVYWWLLCTPRDIGAWVQITKLMYLKTAAFIS